jgi:tetratricopeptide (TPR) repeat protein
MSSYKKFLSTISGLSKVLLLLFELNFFPTDTYSQVDRPFDQGFKKGFKEGFCYNQGINCLAPLPPLTPLPRLNESSDSYTDGYNRGFQTGLDLKRVETGGGSINGTPFSSIPNYKFNDYIPQAPIDDMANVLLYKQKVYNIRVKWIQNRLDGLYELNYNLLSVLSPQDYKAMNQMVSNYVNKNLKGKRIDYADNYIFNQIVTAFKTVERNIYSAYQSASTVNKNESNDELEDLIDEAGSYVKDNPQKAITLLEKIEPTISDKSTLSYCYWLKFLAYTNLGQHEKCIETIEKRMNTGVLSIEEQQICLISKAQVLSILEQGGSALSVLSNPIFNSSSGTIYQSFLRVKAMAYFSIEQFQNCITIADVYLKKATSDRTDRIEQMQVIIYKGLSLAKLGKYDEALILLNTAIQENPKDVQSDLFTSRGMIHYKLKHYQIAVEDLIRATTLDDKDHVALYYLGLSYNELKQRDKACINLKAATKLGNTEAIEDYPIICK